jgi:hypothetical protein
MVPFDIIKELARHRVTFSEIAGCASATLLKGILGKIERGLMREKGPYGCNGPANRHAGIALT